MLSDAFGPPPTVSECISAAGRSKEHKLHKIAVHGRRRLGTHKHISLACIAAAPLLAPLYGHLPRHLNTSALGVPKQRGRLPTWHAGTEALSERSDERSSISTTHNSVSLNIGGVTLSNVQRLSIDTADGIVCLCCLLPVHIAFCRACTPLALVFPPSIARSFAADDRKVSRVDDRAPLTQRLTRLVQPQTSNPMATDPAGDFVNRLR